MQSVLVALSGGVDSSVAALLLQRAGYRVSAVTMLLWGGKRMGSSCSTADATRAQQVADQLGIDLRVVDWTKEFAARVSEPHREAFKEGLTTNPCIDCNRSFKLDGLSRLRQDWGFDYVATGHYARVNASGLLQRAVDKRKDQSYVLATARASVLASMLFPLGELTKQDVRDIARDAGLDTAKVRDSMGLCLDRTDILEPVSLTLKRRDGSVVGTSPEGAVLTVGQRRGIGVAGGERAYVLDIDMGTKSALVGNYDDLMSTRQDLSHWTALDSAQPDVYQTSAHGTELKGALTTTAQGGRSVAWQQPQRLVSPGQLVVGYANGAVVGYGFAAKHQGAGEVSAVPQSLATV